jgi:hypothetical protein
MPSKIEDYALIGDCETAALVNCQGSIDWLCWPDFSSSACFAALLGTEKHGYWKISPAAEGSKSTRKYRDHTLILETIFENDDGAVRLIDFMPIREHNSTRNSDIVRIVEGIRGSMDLSMAVSLRFDYGRTPGSRQLKTEFAPSPVPQSPSFTLPFPFTEKTSTPPPSSPSTRAIAHGSPSPGASRTRPIPAPSAPSAPSKIPNTSGATGPRSSSTTASTPMPSSAPSSPSRP